MNRLVSIALLALCGQCMGEPLLAVACEPPVGISIQYGASSFDQLAAMQANKPLPTKQEFGDPIRDGYERRPTFVLQNADEITITWQESERELKLKKSRKKSGVKEVDSTPAAEEARVLSNMSPLSITAVRESGFTAHSVYFVSTN